MWSHYGEIHAGLCFEFSTTSNNILSRTDKIHYESAYTVVKLFSEKKDWSKETILTKSNHWKYEEEWRLLSGWPELLQKTTPKRLRYPSLERGMFPYYKLIGQNALFCLMYPCLRLVTP
jgi:hypothetical protein